MSASKDDSLPSPRQIQRQQYMTQIQRVPSQSSDLEDDIVEIFDDPSLSSPSATDEDHGL